ncbi:MAG: AraC family transcriptional regulator [Bacteroidota bacterium]
MIPVRLHITPTKTQLEQMASMIGIEPVENQIHIPPAFGSGFLRYYALPYEIQLHHYCYNLHQQVQVNGINDEEDGMYMLQINLSNRIIEKNIGEGKRRLSESGKSGVIFYSPGFHSSGVNEVNQEFEVVFFSFPPATVSAHLNVGQWERLFQQRKFCMYTELPEALDQELRKTLIQEEHENPFVKNGQRLEILGKVLNLFGQRKYMPEHRLTSQDIDKMFAVKEVLLQHIFGSPPTIDQLAVDMAMSKSKLKADFKSLFGNSIYQYYLSRKMEVAKDLLIRKEGTVSEIGYRLGYSNIAQFSAQFKKHHGCTPGKVKQA